MKDYSLKINGHQYDVTVNDVNEESTSANVVVNGTPYTVEIEGAKASATKKIQVSAPKAAASAPAQVSAPKPAAGGSGTKVVSPLPGTIVSIKVNVGDTVSAGQTLIVLEAMKMENNIDALQGGTVKSISVQAGATVMEGDLLIVLE